MKPLVQLLAPILLLVGAATVQAAIISVDTMPGGAIDGTRAVVQGDSFDVDVLIEDVIDLAGFQFDLGFDDAVLTATAITSGGVFDPLTFNVADIIGADSVTFAEITLGFPGLDIIGPAVLATISFDAIAAGNSGLILSNVLLSDSLGGSITPVTENNGQMAVTSAVPVPGTLLLLTTGFVLVGIRRKNNSPGGCSWGSRFPCSHGLGFGRRTGRGTKPINNRLWRQRPSEGALNR